MIWFLWMQIPPLAYCAAYLVHSIRRRRLKQAATIGVLSAANILAIAALMYEFFAMP